MRVEFSVEICNNSSTENYRLLDRIVNEHFFYGKHEWYCPDPDSIKKSNWLAEEGRLITTVKELLNKSAVKNSYSNIKKSDIVLTQENVALEFERLSDSLYIILENINTDRNFIEGICRAYNKNRIIESIKNEWIRFDGEGGTGRIDSTVEKHLAKKFKARLLVILDSDKENALDSPSTKIAQIVSFCILKDVKAIVLNKREMENYIPENLLLKLEDLDPNFSNAYLTLNDEQKDFYDLENGFSNSSTLPKKQEDLFKRISSKDPLFKALRNGIVKGSKIKKSKLSELFLRSEITKEALENRCAKNKNELIEILSEIEKRL